MWIAFGDWISGAFSDDGLAIRISEGFDRMGAATSFAFVTFVAAMLGSAIWTLFLRRLVQWVQIKLDHPKWDEWIRQARTVVRDYEQYCISPKDDDGMQNTVPTRSFDEEYNVPSQHYGAHLEAEVVERTRKQSEVEFRIVLAIVSFFLSAALISDGGWLWCWTLLVPMALWLEVGMLESTSKDLINRYKLKAAIEDVIQLEKLIAGAGDDKSRDRLKVELEIATEERKDLNLSINRRGAKIYRRIRG